MAGEREILSEYYDNQRSGVVVKTEAGYEVDLYQDDVFEKTVEVHTPFRKLCRKCCRELGIIVD